MSKGERIYIRLRPDGTIDVDMEHSRGKACDEPMRKLMQVLSCVSIRKEGRDCYEWPGMTSADSTQQETADTKDTLQSGPAWGGYEEEAAERERTSL